MNFPFDIPYAAVHGGFRHSKLQRDLHPGAVLHPQIEDRKLIRSKVAHLPEERTFKLCKFRPDIQSYPFFPFFPSPDFFFFLPEDVSSSRISDPLDFPSRLLWTITFAIIDPSSIVPLDIIRVAAALSAVHHNGVELAPLINVVNIGPARATIRIAMITRRM